MNVPLLDQTLELAKDWHTAIVPVVYGGPSAPGWECREPLESVLRDGTNSAKKFSRVWRLICILYFLGCLSALAGVNLYLGQTGRRAKHSAWTSSIHAGISFSSPLVGKSSLGFDMAKPTAQIHIVGPHTLFKSLAHLEASIPMRWNPSMFFFGGRSTSNDLPCRGFAWCFLCFWEPSRGKRCRSTHSGWVAHCLCHHQAFGSCT